MSLARRARGAGSAPSAASPPRRYCSAPASERQAQARACSSDAVSTSLVTRAFGAHTSHGPSGKAPAARRRAGQGSRGCSRRSPTNSGHSGLPVRRTARGGRAEGAGKRSELPRVRENELVGCSHSPEPPPPLRLPLMLTPSGQSAPEIPSRRANGPGRGAAGGSESPASLRPAWSGWR